MKQLILKLVPFSIFVLLLSPSVLIAEGKDRHAEGVLHKLEIIPGENPQIQLDESWYTIDSNSDIFMCEKKMSRKNPHDLDEFINFRLTLEPSTEGIYNKIYILCE